ncbi:hypothetical protein CAPTEDRAFT_192972 [Capitella teleta]|uniref:Uncharacterized protein n=1 Tax=Capitella teleta TaxID=283909 RepID=R7TLI3_CAPTE|nr:hypothetical protein CAPTEDRAFT_192972 [Capitella teleta]|eukprot:ELT94347.1 hypothetical protein CAPTEDRAFT_192972 [Capitella teleta]
MASPAELLNQQRLQTVLPVKTKDFDRGSQHREHMAAEREKRRHRFNQRAREFRELQLNENVYVQLDPEKSKWQRALKLSQTLLGLFVHLILSPDTSYLQAQLMLILQKVLYGVDLLNPPEYNKHCTRMWIKLYGGDWNCTSFRMGIK